MISDMWDLWKTFSHGRVSLRQFSLLATAIIVAFFTVATLLSTPVYADGATRSSDGKTVTYQSKSLTLLSPQQIPPSVANTMPPTSGYGYFDITNHKAYLILTSGDATTANKGQYVVYDFNPPNDYKNGTTPQELDLTTDGSHGGAKGTSNCNNSETGAIGWIVCPVVTFLAKGMDYIYGIVAQFLEVKTVSADTHSSLYQMWAFVRDIANVCFVIGFLIVIFSQITNVGISNYGIKSALPRLIIAAILVNISYTICAAGVDISNILGHSIHDLFVGLMERFNTGAGYGATGSFDMPDWSMIAAAILAGTGTILGVGVAVYTGAIFLLLPTLLGAIVAALVALIILAARQALIIIMIIVAPLAFVAYILPNTEKYFDKWREAFMTLLLLFPIFSIVFSGAQLAGMAIVQNAGGNIVMIILGMAVQVAPLFITPLLLKFSGGIIGRIAGIVNNPNKGLIDRTRNWASGRAQERKNKVLADHNNSRPFHRYNPARRTAVALDTRRRRIDGRRKAYESMADNRFAGTRQGQMVEAMNREATNEKQRVDNVFAGSARGRQLELQSRHLGVQKQEIENSMLDSNAGRNLTYRQHMADVQKTIVSNNFEDSHLGHTVSTAKRRAETIKSRIESDHQAQWDTDIQTNAELKAISLDAKGSEVKATLAKGQADAMMTEILAKGDASEHVLNLRGVNAETQDRVLRIAREMKDDNLNAQLTASVKAMADRQIAENKATVLKQTQKAIDEGRVDDVITVTDAHGTVKNVVEYAAGIKGDVGRRSVVAQARSESSKFTIDDVKNIESTLDYDIASNPVELHKRFTNATTEAERVAYTSIMAKRGAPGALKLRDMAEEMDARFNRGEINREELNDYKELVLAQNSNIMGLGKDLEFFFTNAAYGLDDADPTLAGKIKTFSEITNESSTWGNLSADAFSRMNIINQMQGLRILAHKNPDKYRTLVDNLQRSPSAMANMKDDVVQAIMRGPDDPYWTTGSVYNTPSLDELTEFEQHALFEAPRTGFAERDGYTQDADYWRNKYESQLRKTNRMFTDAKARGIDYEHAPATKPQD